MFLPGQDGALRRALSTSASRSPFPRNRAAAAKRPGASWRRRPAPRIWTPPRARPGTPRTFCSSRTRTRRSCRIDMHELVAMVAPRAILAIENTGIDRLGSQAGSVSMKAATEVYKALGDSRPDRLHSGRQPRLTARSRRSQTADVQAFVDKFLARQDDREHEHREELVQHQPHDVGHLDHAARCSSARSSDDEPHTTTS